MSRLPVISGQDVVKYLIKKKGFTHSRTKGSHVILRSPINKIVPVPLHSELDRGTLNSILELAGISRDEFIRDMRG